MEKISLFARHSFNECVCEGYAFLAKQLMLVVRVLMPYFTIMSLFAVVSAAYNIKLNVAVMAHEIVSLEEILLAMLLYTVSWLLGVIAVARMFLLFRRLTAVELPAPEDVSVTKTTMWKRSLGRTMHLAWRTLPYSVWVLILNMPGFPIVEPFFNFVSGLSMEYQMLVCCGVVLLGIVAAVFLAPFIYTFYCRMMKPTVSPNDIETMRTFGFKEAYKKGFSHKGKILSLTVWNAFLYMIACAVILLPAIIATVAYLSSVESRVNFGDTALIPTTGYALMFVAGVIAVTFCALLQVAFSASLMYLFGDIYSKEK